MTTCLLDRFKKCQHIKPYLGTKWMQEQWGALDIPVLAECRALHWERGRSTSRSLFEGVIVLNSVKCQPSSCLGPFIFVDGFR